MFADIMWIVVTVSALFVYYDASKNNIGSIPGETGFTNADAGMWATSTLLLWIIAFPIYLLNRSQLIEKANANPKEPSKGRSVIIALLSVFVLFSFINLTINQETDDSLKTNQELSHNVVPSPPPPPPVPTPTLRVVSTNNVQFCTKVDENLECINPGIRFKHGKIYAKLETNDHFQQNHIYLTIYREKGIAESLFDEGSYEVNPDWNAISVPLTFYNPGRYRVVFRKLVNVKIAEGIVTIY
jgi:hypothetical protein